MASEGRPYHLIGRPVLIQYLFSCLNYRPHPKEKKDRKTKRKLPKKGKHSVKTGVNSINHASGRTGEANSSYYKTFKNMTHI